MCCSAWSILLDRLREEDHVQIRQRAQGTVVGKEAGTPVYEGGRSVDCVRETDVVMCAELRGAIQDRLADGGDGQCVGRAEELPERKLQRAISLALRPDQHFG